jgi:hypothetical protein
LEPVLSAELRLIPTEAEQLAPLMFDGEEPNSHLRYLEHPLYDRYMHLPKGLLVAEEAPALREVHEGLLGEPASRFQFVSGWAAAEAALVMADGRNARKTRMSLVEGAGDAWVRAHDRLVAVGQAATETNDHYALKQRVELALASIPLLEGIVAGDVRVQTLDRVADAYLQIGIDNMAFGRSKRSTGDSLRACFHDGLAYEILALLGLNDGLTTRKLAMPSTARNDSGYHSSNLTHDVMILKQRSGRLTTMVPAEVKTRMAGHHKKRYKALILDGSSLDVLQAGEPGPMTDLFARAYRGDGSKADIDAVGVMAQELWEMVAQYTSGAVLDVGNNRSITRYHDASRVRLGGYALLAAAA